MSDIAFRIDFNNILQVLQATEAETEQTVAAVAEHVRSRIVMNVQERSPSSGATTRYNPKRTVYPAAEGESPNTDTAHLANSVQREKLSRFEQQVYVGAEYGAALENNGHPFVLPAVDATGMELPRLTDGLVQKLRSGR